MNLVLIARRFLIRDWRAGELTLIALSVLIAVAGVTTVGFFTDRVILALNRQANQLLGADLVVSNDRPLPAEWEAEARTRGLQVTTLLRFPSMAQRGGKNVLADIKVVQAGYPLRGELRIGVRKAGSGRLPLRSPGLCTTESPTKRLHAPAGFVSVRVLIPLPTGSGFSELVALRGPVAHRYWRTERSLLLPVKMQFVLLARSAGLACHSRTRSTGHCE